MAVNVSVQDNGGLLSDIILLTRCDYTLSLGNPFDIMQSFCPYIQPMLLHKYFDHFPPEGGCLCPRL